MNFQGKAVLVYLEEDNIARAFFRIKPLLTEDGRPDGDLQTAFPDDGYLRIVPDKNEQHTFKERMRSLCGLCLMDLRNLPPEANKIRTNKNYSPTRGETNQYIIYSDAIRPLPEHGLYQVVAEGDVAAAVTPQVYIRKGALIQGPFSRENAQATGNVLHLPPDSGSIHAVTLQNDQELLFYWPKTVERPAPIEPAAQPAPAAEASSAPQRQDNLPVNAYDQIQEMNAQLSENANRLAMPAKSSFDFMPEQPARPLTGTRLYQAPQPAVFPKRAHNPLMETVEQQRYAARYEAPGAVLQKAAALRDVENPIDTLKRALQTMWQSPETQQRAVDTILSQSGIRSLLAKSITAGTRDVTLTAMQSQLQELEAERLMTLMQLDDVKKNLAAAREEALGTLTGAEQKKLDKLRADQRLLVESLEGMQKSLTALEEKQQAAEQTIAAAEALDSVRCVRPSAGASCEKDALIGRVQAALHAAGFVMEAGDAQALLTAYALSAQAVGFCAPTHADAAQALRAFAAALGAPVYDDAQQGGQRLCVLPGGTTPVFLTNAENATDTVTEGAVSLAYLSKPGDAAAAMRRYGQAPYAMLSFRPDQDALPAALPVYPGVDRAAIIHAMLTDKLPEGETLAALNAVRRALAAVGSPLPLTVASQAARFIAATQNDLPGGVAEAIDRAVCCFIVPHIRFYSLPADELKSVLAAMPRALRELKNA